MAEDAKLRQLPTFDPKEQADMLEEIDEVRAEIVAGKVRAVFMVVIPLDQDLDHMIHGLGNWKYHEARGWLAQIDTWVAAKSFQFMQSGGN